MFNIDFNYIIEVLIPTRLRKLKFRKWLKLVLSGIEKIYTEYIGFSSEKIFYIQFNSQLQYIEKILKLKFNEGIYITDGNFIKPFYLHNKEEVFPQVYLGNLFQTGTIYNAGEEVVFNNYYYRYSATGNGTNPDIDTASERTYKIESFIANKEEFETDTVDFYVNIPSSYVIPLLTYDIINNTGLYATTLENIRTICNYYKFLQKKYILRFYE